MGVVGNVVGRRRGIGDDLVHVRLVVAPGGLQVHPVGFIVPPTGVLSVVHRLHKGTQQITELDGLGQDRGDHRGLGGVAFDRGHNIVSGEMDFVGHRNRIKVNKGGKVNATE